MSSPARRRIATLFAALLALALLGFGTLAALPLPVDNEGLAHTAGPTGAGGLKSAWPAMKMPADNTMSDARFAARAELGRLLFYDQVLSARDDMSCATCHHPDLGYSDGRGRSMGAGGTGLGPERTGGHVIRRGAPTIWNAAYNELQFWDGRAKDLEEQARNPITAPEEMGETETRAVAQLTAIPEYRRLFDDAFGGVSGSSISLASITKALAAFERTQLSSRSAFDRYAAGDRSAMTVSERRGFDVFRSGQARCFECHSLPTFASPDFKVVGVPGLKGEAEDHGRGDLVTGGSSGMKGAFKVPTLRNVALTAPYMHNGRFASLPQVIVFYEKGGGPGHGVPTPNLDDKIRPFQLTGQQTIDLLAFLNALTDESALAPVPERVPSGLPVVPRLRTAAEIARASAPPPTASMAPLESREFVVRQGESVQAVVDAAGPGSTIRVMPGEYHESITIDTERITLIGGDGTAATRPVLDGRGVLSDGVIASGNDFSLSNMEFRRYLGNGVVAQETRNVTMRDVKLHDTGLYGVYPVRASRVTLQRIEVSGARDAGIYVGQSKGIVVEDCIAHANVTGIEIENSVDARVERNHVYNNTGGILVFALPGNPSKEAKRTRVASNRVIGNNHTNFADPAAIVAKVPPGGGIFVLAADDNEITDNEVAGNDSFGVAILGLESLFPGRGPFDVGAFPDRTRVHANRFSGNGTKPHASILEAGLKGADLLWDVTGPTNTWNETGASSAVPVLGATWPGFVRHALFQVLTRLK